MLEVNHFALYCSLSGETNYLIPFTPPPIFGRLQDLVVKGKLVTYGHFSLKIVFLI